MSETHRTAREIAAKVSDKTLAWMIAQQEELFLNHTDRATNTREILQILHDEEWARQDSVK